MKASYDSKIYFPKVLLILFFLYNVNYKFIPGDIPTSYLSLGFIVVASLYWILREKRFPVANGWALVSALLLFFCSMISYFDNIEHADLYMIRTTFIYLIMVLFVSPFIACIFKNDRKEVLKTVGYAGLVNGILILGMLIFKPLQYIYLPLLSEKTFLLIGGNDAIESLMSLRMIGITGFSAYTTGFVQVLCAICYIYYMILRDGRIRLKLSDYILLIIIFLSALVSARSSLIGIFLSIIILMFNMNSLRFIKTLSLTIISVIFLFSIITMLLPDNLSDFFMNWATEFFVSGTKTGSLQTNIDMYIYGLNDFSAFGQSRWYGDNNDYFMNTDVGWYRLAFSIGFLGVIFWYITLMNIFRFNRLFTSRMSIENIISICIFIYITIMMFKGAIIFDSFQSVLILLVLDIVFYNRNKYEA
ncbi:TPA: O8 family O-antigen polymerase [Escherichia coli]|nr:O8 family O-antigen polymerase [Escherichia coli]EFN2572828.1 O8 family O-antigen polymerase [Escherichia coli]HAX5066381.1 O8 family O-antigen polymerase [Escherichia coli]HAX5070793.1 O8 family O-antigen polymerase [Escherichia coli]HAX5079608.1 O8 family O-antigen polymerase [Escherichia coli]